MFTFTPASAALNATIVLLIASACLAVVSGVMSSGAKRMPDLCKTWRRRDEAAGVAVASICLSVAALIGALVTGLLLFA
jgi:hypothetical protein